MAERAPATSAAPHELGKRTIDDAIAALERVRGELGSEFDEAVESLRLLEGKVVTLGVGKSGHAAQKVAATFRSIGLAALHLHASDALHGDLGVLEEGDVAILFSKSGATRELMTLVPHLRAHRVKLIAIVGTRGSPLARECDIVLDASVEREGCPLDVAPMASVLAAQAIGDALAAVVCSARGFTAEDFARLHPGGTLGARLTLTVSDVMRRGEELPRVGAEATLKEAVIEITRTGFGAVCVLSDDERLVGFLTDGDVRRALLEFDNLAEVRVADRMSRTPFTVSPDLPLMQALLALEQREKAYLTAPVVLADGRCVGLLRLHDTVRAHLNE